MPLTEEFLDDCFISIDGVDYSGQGTNVALVLSTRTTDVSAPFGDDVDRVFVTARSWSAEVELYSQEGTNGQDLWDLWATKARVPVEFRMSADAVSASNPKYTATAASITEVSPLSGGHGDVRKVTLSLVGASDLVRAVV